MENERYSLEDVRALTIACNRTDEIYKKYVLFGVQDPISTLRAPHLASKETQEAVLRNMRTFQPELTRLEVFSLQCKATLIPYARDMAAIVAQTQEPEAIRESIHQVRRGSYGAYAGTLIKAAEETLPIQYRLQLAAVLSDTASVYSDIFTPDLREAIVRRLTTQIASTSNDELRMSFAHIIQVMSASQCEGLCKY